MAMQLALVPSPARTSDLKWKMVLSHLLKQNMVKSKEMVGNSWTVLKVILGHKYHHNH